MAHLIHALFLKVRIFNTWKNLQQKNRTELEINEKQIVLTVIRLKYMYRYSHPKSVNNNLLSDVCI